MSLKLKRAEEMNRNYISMDTLYWLPETAAFFDKYGDDSTRVKANYLLGCMYRDMGDAPTALKYYHKSISNADTTITDCDFHTIGSIYGQMADIFHDQMDYEDEIKANRKAVHFLQLSGDTIFSLMMYAHMQDAYYMLHQFDSALYYGKNAFQRLKNIGQYKQAAGVLPIVFDTYIETGKYQLAKKYMDYFEQHSDYVDKQGNVAEGHEVYYANKGDYYLGINKVDSAEYYFRKLNTSDNKDIEIKEIVYRGLYNVYKRHHIMDSVIKYVDLLESAHESSIQRKSTADIVKMQKVYNYTEQEKLAEERAKKVSTYKTLLFILLISMSMVIGVTLYIIHYKRKKEKEKLTEMNEQYNSTLLHYYQSVEDLKKLKGNYDQYKKEKEEELQTLQTSLAIYQDDHAIPEDWNIDNDVLANKVVMQLHSMGATGESASDKLWNRLFELIRQSIPTFYNTILSKEYDLNGQEQKTCFLIKLRFIPTEIANLLGLSRQRITNLRAQINFKLFGKSGAKNVDFNIRQL